MNNIRPPRPARTCFWLVPLKSVKVITCIKKLPEISNTVVPLHLYMFPIDWLERRRCPCWIYAQCDRKGKSMFCVPITFSWLACLLLKFLDNLMNRANSQTCTCTFHPLARNIFDAWIIAIVNLIIKTVTSSCIQSFIHQKSRARGWNAERV